MLTAAKSRWFENLFALYNSNLLRRRFHSFRIKGLPGLTEPDRSKPLILYANHTSWWDGLAAFQISRAAHLDAYLMMEERQLRRYFLFRKLGAFSVVRENPREAYRTLEYAADLLYEDPGRCLWIFPQGKITPAGKRPLGFYKGIGKLVEIAGDCRVAPVVFRYEFEGEYKPSIYAAVAECEVFVSGREVTVDAFEKEMEDLLLSLGNDIVSREFAGYRDLI
ncbi:MAG: acyl-phosphate glycerol 3-phosphate acyltransferase [Acidobacteria bacterium]|nr:MAG: acyl-phosphate glycerol 3-phosphate acyltransferase [Acidobacteriota bacterium]REK01313.1 MAG: acyl-phosphate glycerol 3-phosphate acyltransferase [Acidobacteriota bacterium]REK14269.1 MAG: acyl-phosphate glycerol 3-phosphate acyltransferase [Acidobacteriota bacterium]REK44984.1 MAG: acyl-phosphate glycerol 3-phosphate acyltransferase [Acidobacteriota bacterium]